MSLHKGETPLLLAAQAGSVIEIEHALDMGADIYETDDNGNTALHLASRNGHPDSIEALVEAGSDIDALNDAGYSPIRLAAKFSHFTSVQTLLVAGARSPYSQEISSFLVPAGVQQPKTAKNKVEYTQSSIDFHNEPVKPYDNKYKNDSASS